MRVKKDLLRTISYFLEFKYAPTFEEIYTCFPIKTSRARLQSILNLLLTENKVIIQVKDRQYNQSRYTIQGYSTLLNNLKFKIQNSKLKIKKIENYIRLLSKFPQIELIGLSGTVAMMSADKHDDIDLFIITAKNRLWTGRLLALATAQTLGLRRGRKETQATDKVCLNLFFDGKALAVPMIKQSESVAREVLQMKPILAKNGVYLRFLEANTWVYEYFPNSKLKLRSSNNPVTCYMLHVTCLIERLAKFIQLYLINRHRTNELVSDTQLWFHPKK